MSDDFIPTKQFELETAGRKPRQNLLSLQKRSSSRIGWLGLETVIEQMPDSWATWSREGFQVQGYARITQRRNGEYLAII